MCPPHVDLAVMFGCDKHFSRKEGRERGKAPGCAEKNREEKNSRADHKEDQHTPTEICYRGYSLLVILG